MNCNVARFRAKQYAQQTQVKQNEIKELQNQHLKELRAVNLNQSVRPAGAGFSINV